MNYELTPSYGDLLFQGDTAACNHVKKIVEKHTKEREEALRGGAN